MIWAGRFTLLLASALALGLLPAARADANPDRIVKVLPHYVDWEGRHALSPSLFERDAYQVILKAHPEKRGGLQFDVRWKARKAPGRQLALRLEMVTTRHPKGRPLVVESPLPAGRKGWARVKVDAATLRGAGDMIAWRVSLVEGGQALGSQQSFLW
jgi:hypothetical protein